MITHPKPEELTEAVGRWIEQVRPQLDPRNQFLARVAANALAAVTRELTLGDQAQAAAVERLEAILGHGGNYRGLNWELCEKLRAGEMGVATPGLLATLRGNVLDQLAIDQPSYKYEGP
ncbi:MAG: protein kinase [Alphaproteobacteria bacterium]|nr:protein kinase [Alphaproteobacteria bacterium]